MNKINYKKAQKKLDRKGLKLYIAAWRKPSKMTLSEFVEAFLGDLRINKNTRRRFSSNITKQFCEKGRLRSLSDLYSTTKTYFPEVTLEQCDLELQRLVKEQKINSGYCATVHRQVFSAVLSKNNYNHVMRKGWNDKYGASNTDELGLPTTRFQG